MLKTLRQPRYAALGALMVVVAIACVAAGTWQIARFEQKVRENDVLRANAHASTTQVEDVLPLVGGGPAPSSDGVEFRSVRVTGAYDETAQTLVRSRTLGDETGFLVLTPLHTPGATLLVVRGFVAQPASGRIPTPASPPGGPVTVLARVQPPESRHDEAAALAQHQVQSINPGEQAARLGGPVYNGYAELESRQPGTRGLKSVASPDLSNPAGGALEPQHFAYVIQWYLFAVLALAAPFAMARAETKHHGTEQFDDVPAPVEAADEAGPERARAAKLADRYGECALVDGHDRSAVDRTGRDPQSHAFDAAYWDERYRGRDSVWGAAPNRFVAEEVPGLPPGRALDLACGEGRNAIWLDSLGWRVVAVDFSAVALEKGRAGEQHTSGAARISWVVGDATTFVAGEPVDLALLCYLQVDAASRRAAVRQAAAALAPGGTLLVIAHDSRNLADGTGGPQHPAALYTAADVAGDLAGTDLVVERAEEVLRPVDGAERPAIDALLRARRPA